VHLDRATLEAGLPRVRQSPQDRGTVELIVRRPAIVERERVAEALLSTIEGLVGDNWSKRPDPHTDLQLTLMNARAAALVAGHPDRWQLAGDQLYVELDLSDENIPPGTRLLIGSAVIEISEEPHTGCGKFSARFGVDALKFVNSEVGRELHLRGVNAKVIADGVVRSGDLVVRAEGF
jgi:MOSC domain-containing protein YiiM